MQKFSAPTRGLDEDNKSSSSRSQRELTEQWVDNAPVGVLEESERFAGQTDSNPDRIWSQRKRNRL